VATAVGLLWLRGRSLREQERQRASKLAAAEELRRELAAASEAGASSVLARKLVPACPGEMAMVVGPPTFCVDRHEYPGPGRLPQTRISLGEAQALCRARGAALCSEAQWRQACEGPERTLYCYGPQHELGRCNLGERGQAAGPLRAAGALAGCQSAAGVFDLHGNAAEWVAEGLVKGGSARSDETAATCVGAQRPEPEQRSEWVGFRCCAPLSAVAR
jgi:formylglycine-generating enzyme required for sulfatase activity